MDRYLLADKNTRINPAHIVAIIDVTKEEGPMQSKIIMLSGHEFFSKDKPQDLSIFTSF